LNHSYPNDKNNGKEIPLGEVYSNLQRHRESS